LHLTKPERDAPDIIKKMRERGVVSAVLVLNVKDEAKYKIELLLSGADDCIPRPFALEELRTRVEIIFKRRLNKPGMRWYAGEWVINPLARKVSKNNEEISLTYAEFMILEHLIRNPNKPVCREDLLCRIQGDGSILSSNLVDVHVKNLRKKLDLSREGILQTVRGVGYLLKN
jgi:DNA-binding response OmpR family regulator